jgi:hypothetical protein
VPLQSVMQAVLHAPAPQVGLRRSGGALQAVQLEPQATVESVGVQSAPHSW